ncbi:MAG: thiamine-phosphate kinase [Acidobacteriota bacterium]
MTVGRLGESGIIQRLADRVGRMDPHGRLECGIGDDGAVAVFGAGDRLVFTTDVLIEDVHFRRCWMPARSLGHKVLAVSLSDLAAMGATPELFLLDLGLPAAWPVADLDALADGLAQLASRHGVGLAGGDTVVSPRLHVGVSAIGRIGREQTAVRRVGGQPGDAIAVSGSLGGAAAGLALLEDGWRWTDEGPRPPTRGGTRLIDPVLAGQALRAHLEPEPEVDLGTRLPGAVSAGVDLSDGLSRDLARLCEASGCGARIDAARVPVAPAARLIFDALGQDPVVASLAGGEDYRLLVCGRHLETAGEALADDLTVVGELEPVDAGLRLRTDAGLEPLPEPAFTHFSSP